MSDSDIMSFLTYQNAGGMNTDFTSVKSALKWDPIYYSRTANASYGIGLAAVILNDEAMGYNSKIIFITDSSVSVDSRFLKLAINNKIPIYFFCIGDFNTAALIGYAQLTGGKVYSAKTAAEINQSCNEIGPKTFVGETDTDGDGFTDIEEMSGLIVSSNCKIVNTDYMKADTDDDGLDDNEEVDVELTKVEIPDGKEIYEVESVDFQLNMLINFSDDIYDLMFRSYEGETKESQKQALEDLYTAWKSGDIETFLEEDNEEELAGYTEEDKKIAEDYNNQMLYDRNKNMAKAAEDLMSQGKNVFYVVGAAHYAGEGGIIDLLEKDGYTAERVQY